MYNHWAVHSTLGTAVAFSFCFDMAPKAIAAVFEMLHGKYEVPKSEGGCRSSMTYSIQRIIAFIAA